MRRKILIGLTAALAVSATAFAGFAGVSSIGGEATNKLASRNLNVSIGGTAYAEPEEIMPGQKLDPTGTSFTVTNDGDLPEYTRVTVKKIFTRNSGEGDEAKTELIEGGEDAGDSEDTEDPAVMTLSDGSWLQASGGMESDSGVTEVYYYARPLNAGESVVLPLEIEIAKAVGNEYQNASLSLEVQVDSVQYAEGENEVNQEGILASFGVIAELDGSGSITALVQ